MNWSLLWIQLISFFNRASCQLHYNRENQNYSDHFPNEEDVFFLKIHIRPLPSGDHHILSEQQHVPIFSIVFSAQRHGALKICTNHCLATSMTEFCRDPRQLGKLHGDLSSIFCRIPVQNSSWELHVDKTLWCFSLHQFSKLRTVVRNKDFQSRVISQFESCPA